MPTIVAFDREKSELNSILSSGILDRAPNLAQLLTYVCSKYFEGAAGQIKEYNIAVEALGRPAGFDQKKDSIVRVEAHKLRKRLNEYYESVGADHAIRIEIPSGQYAPQFVIRSPLDDPPAKPEKVDVDAAAENPKTAKHPAWTPRLRMALLLATIGTLGATAWWVSPRTHTAASASSVEAPGALPLTGDEIRISAGLDSGGYSDGFAHMWQSDRFFQGGTVVHASTVPLILGTRDPRLYQNRREGTFSYHIPLNPGVYELRLHFAETLYGDSNAAGGGETTRLFSVLVNGREVLHHLDVIAEVGASAADIKVFKDVSPGADGKLRLEFVPRNNQAFLNAIEIRPGVPGSMRPIRIIAQDHAYTDKAGRYWEADRYARGGQLVLRHEDVLNTPEPEFYRGERFGNISYVIPVTPGRYGMTLHFSETWFGPGLPGAGGKGSRLFDILCNGVALKRNFDIFAEAGGSRRVVTWTAHGLEPDHQGKLVVSLAPVENYASLNALEIVEEQ